MGVPALFRWLSKKYPKIVTSVIEAEEEEVLDAAGDPIKLPVDITQPNPNGEEFDSLYLDMNWYRKPAPETEEEMMLEVFKYTNRVVNMVRPRKLLFMAIDGVAPRAKMNQQRSRRFRTAQEAKDKAEAHKLAVAEWEAMGKIITDDEKNKESWDSNAITPGTPFMDLLTSSLRYWVVEKMNTDPGWKDLQVIISDASVPGEGEHKIMDFIRRQRTNPGHDPNTRHVIYGLDADLIMLALATHEPYFRVLREDVFSQDKGSGCRICGQEGHYAAQCTALKSEIKKPPPPEKKPFIFLDVAILREYLESELNVNNTPFPFDLEQAIDDWVLLIFFVGNDFLPHLPSLEIREGAIDTLLRIWKMELPRMGGYLTNHGQLVLSRAQIILEGLARREDEIFRKRQETEQRQDQEAKRRKIEKSGSGENAAGDIQFAAPSAKLGLTASTTSLSSLPQRADNAFAAKADSIGLGAPRNAQSLEVAPVAAQALAGSNRDVVANRAAIRMANMSAAEMLKAELSGLIPVKQSASAPKPEPVVPTPPPKTDPELMDDGDIPGLGNAPSALEFVDDGAGDMDVEPNNPITLPADEPVTPVAGIKRKLEDIEGDDTDEVAGIDEESSEDNEDASYALVVRADGSVEQTDNVRLYEPGYKKRYYQQKFGISENDDDFRRKLTKHYVEGIAWVLHYYYQGTPSWQWYYPYHFAPFASDFEGLENMELEFTLGQPFKPYEQLMGVFPPASRKHIPEIFHDLMTNEESPIHDFYPSTFQIDMNGKKMLWQGVALLPFIDEKRLLDAMAEHYPKLTEDEVRRNSWGQNVIFVADEHSIYPFFEGLYGKRKEKEPQLIPTNLSKGISGSVLPNPDCLPGSTYYSPLTSMDLQDIKNDRSLSALYFFPKQLSPHRSMFLPGVIKPARQLTGEDLARRGRGHGRGGGMDRGGRGRGGYQNGSYNNGHGYGSTHSQSQTPISYVSSYTTTQSRTPYTQGPQQGFGGYGSNGRPPIQNYGNNYPGQSRGGPPPRGGAPPSRGMPPNRSYSGGYGGGSGGYGGQANSGYGGYGGHTSRGSYGGSGGQDSGGSYTGYGNQNDGQARGGYGGGYNGGGYQNPSRGRGRGF
ncbi:exoribonuclease 2 [Suillus bovinus]|uniref:exoribonuclease 2 n=1 Tax=Suillus bovinus TaxID=48563 RepID=UPI001B877DD5|nr:exoribonuclease 2 [Suillus bovinus]KAG2158950.1 exoribonuclease 2 [Suillus bovinus]